MTDQATDPVAEPAAEPAGDAPAARPLQQRRKAKAPPAARSQALPVLERLYGLHPKMFGARFLPLKLGAYQDLMARHPGVFSKDELKLALGQHARSTRYLESVAAGEKRHDLDGNPVEDVAPEHVHHAIAEVFRRRQARSKEDLQPWLRGRLVGAIRASGLSREDYTARVGTLDERMAAALEAAFAEVAEAQAKREALRRTFQSSGRSAAEFAEMYGMDLATVEDAVRD